MSPTPFDTRDLLSRGEERWDSGATTLDDAFGDAWFTVLWHEIGALNLPFS